MYCVNVSQLSSLQGYSQGAKGTVPLAKSACLLAAFGTAALSQSPTLGNLNVFSDNYLGKTSCSPAHECVRQKTDRQKYVLFDPPPPCKIRGGSKSTQFGLDFRL